MSEEERVKTLEEMEAQRKEIDEILKNMPLSMRTDALKNKKRELETKLDEIERAITTFSRKVVYVKDNKDKWDFG